MNIQKIDESQQPPSYLAVSPRMMPMPELGAPRFNPLLSIWRRKGIVVIVTALCLLGALAKYMFSTQIFRSESKLFVQMGFKSADPTLPSGRNALQAQCDLVKSPAILAEVLASAREHNLKTVGDPAHRWSAIKEHLSAAMGRDNGIMSLAFDSAYPGEAPVILKSVIDAYATFHNKEKRANTAEVTNYRDKAQAALEKKEKELLDFKKANSALGLVGDKGNLTMQQLAALQEALTQARIDTTNTKTSYQAAQTKLHDPAQLHTYLEYLRANGTLVGGDSTEQTLRSQLGAMERQLDELKSRYLPNHPAVRSAQATVAGLRERLGTMDRTLGESHLLSLRQKITAAENRQAELQHNYDDQRKVAIELNVKLAEADQIETEIKRLTATVDKAESQLSRINTADAGTPTIEVLDEPSEPTLVQPVRSVMLMQGLVIGLVLGCFGALVRDWTDQGLRGGDDIADALGVSVLGSVPHIAGPANPLGHARKVDLEPGGDVAETYRTIRTAVFFGTPDRESRTILVTSPGPGEGKSTFASNLAIAMAQTGKRILLVDCDFRRPIQHRIFESRPGIGLSTVLAGHEALDKAIQSTGIAGLDILPAGPVPSNPSEILNSQSFNEVLEELSVRYEHVVVDSPAVMAFADARILAAMCSVTILVLRTQSTTRKAAMHARRALQSVGAVILGAVVNDVPRGRDRHGDYGAYNTYRSGYNGESAHSPASSKTTAMVPARSFLDLRRK